MDDVEVLHDHERIGAHAQGHIQRNDAVALAGVVVHPLAAIVFRDDAGRGKQIGHALDGLESGHGIETADHVPFGRISSVLQGIEAHGSRGAVYQAHVISSTGIR